MNFFGVELVKRHGRVLALTDAGRQLATITREQFGALSEFSRHVKAQRASLSIVAANSIAVWQIIPKLTEIRRALPQHELSIEHKQTADIIRGVMEGRYDIGILREIALPQTLGRKALGGAKFALFIPKALAHRMTSTQPWLRLPLEHFK